jgi:hypothetical protein
MVIFGTTRFGSSREPARAMIKCGRDSASLKSGVPHRGQKLRRMTVPLAARLEYSLRAPLMVTDDLGKTTFTVPLPAPRYWQSRHQHTRVVSGSAIARSARRRIGSRR